MLELLVAQVQKEFASQVEKSPEVAEAVARLDEEEDKVLEVIALSLEKATEVVGETCMSGARKYLRELERRNSARAATTEKHKAERGTERERDRERERSREDYFRETFRQDLPVGLPGGSLV